ncbi:MAG: NAD(+) synthase [Bacteroidaceae bacterium]
MNLGFVKVATAIPNVKVASCNYNTQRIENLIAQAEGKKVEIICFPELSLTAYTCQDLFAQQLLLDEAETALMKLLDFTRPLSIIVIVGLPIVYKGTLLNCAAVMQKGKLLGIVPKTYLPNYKEFYEQRWFTSAESLNNADIKLCGQIAPLSQHLLFETPQCTFGIEICEDVWSVIPPSSNLALKGAEIVFNLSADNECIGKHTYLTQLLSQQSARCMMGYVFSGCGYGESTQDIIFGGKGLIYENGTMLAESKRFSFEEQLIISEIDVERLRTERRVNTTFSASIERFKNLEICKTVDASLFDQQIEEINLTRSISPHPFVPTGTKLNERCQEILMTQVMGLAKRIEHTASKTVIVGISGGLDSTLALLVCVQTFEQLKLSRKGIIGITMPGFGTTSRTHSNALKLMENLGVTIREINIKDACIQHFKDLGHDINQHNVTYENVQARERTQILMNVANQMNGLVVGTGDLSELALGWATYNGDHMSMYGVNASIPKTLVRHLVTWVANNEADSDSRVVLLDIVDTPISPELIPADEAGLIAQKTEDLVGPYELHDFFLYYFLRFGFSPSKIYFLAKKAFGNSYSNEVIKKWLTTFCSRFFSQQFKRSCLPDGPKVGSCSLSPRGDWRMPSDACSEAWIEECKTM